MESNKTLRTKAQGDRSIKIVFNRLHWSYIIAAILLLSLTVFNFPFTSQEGQPYNFHFFLDFDFLASLDPHRNVITVITCIPIYYIVGVLPGLLGLFLITYSLLSGGPLWINLLPESMELKNTNFIIPKKSRCSLKNLQVATLGRKRLNIKNWLFFLFVSFWAFYIFLFILESYKNTGTFQYFGIYQDIWDGDQIIGQINLGFQLLITVILLFTATFLTILFPRRGMYLETDEAIVKFSYSSFRIQKVEMEIRQPSPVMNLFKEIASKKEVKNCSIVKNKTEKTSTTKIDDFNCKNIPSHFPKLKVLLYISSLTILLIAQFLPHFYLGSFTIPFTNIALLAVLYFLLVTIHTQWFSQQRVFQSDNTLMILRSNRVSGTHGSLYINPSSITEKSSPHSPALIEYILAPILLWEILVIWGTLIIYPSYSNIDIYLILRLSITVFLMITILIFYFKTKNELLFKYGPENYNTPEMRPIHTYYSVFWPKKNHNKRFSFIKKAKNLKNTFKDSRMRIKYISILILFALPTILFILWLAGVFWIKLLV